MPKIIMVGSNEHQELISGLIKSAADWPANVVVPIPDKEQLAQLEFKKIHSTPDIPKVEQYQRESPKISRNAPCPCGSGKKYKKCCI